MEPPAETSIPTLPVETPEFCANPYPYLDAARREHPWLARFSQGYIVHGYQACCDLLADDENLLPGLGSLIDFYGVQGTMWARFMEEIVISRSGPEHARLRASVRHAFTPRHANLVRPQMRKVITALLDEWAPRGAFDFTEFAARFPITVMFGILGVSPEPIERIRTAIEDHTASLSVNLDTRPGFLAAWEVLWDFADTLVKEREASGVLDADALLDALIMAKNAGDLDETELRFMLLTNVVAGYDTSKNQLGLTMKILIERPEMYARCAADIDFCGKVVLESLRYSPIATPFREVARDFTYDGYRFRKGETVICAPPLAGHDPGVFPDPQDFNPDRENANRHVGFGRGPHVCLGQFIARAQLQEGLHLITRRLKNPRIIGEVAWRPFVGAWGLKSLPIAFDGQVPGQVPVLR